MSSNKSKYKAKKQLQTTLGKAPKKYTSVDISHLRKPIDTSVIGLRQVLHLFETATNEVRNYITYECDVLYECKTCRTIYRSLANFILHKRDYCKDSCRKPNEDSDEPPADVMGNSAINLCDDGDVLKFDADKSRLNAVLSRLRKRQESQEIFDEVSGKDFSSENVVEDREDLAKKGAIALEEINGNLSCVFQTLINNVPKDNQEFMINEAMEIHSILNNDEVILGPDGKALSRPDIEGFDFSCEVCKQNFATKKSLIHHIKCKHNNSKEVYLCPEYGCKGNYFPTTYSVFRHLHKVHRKSPMQYKRLRSQIQRNTIKNTTLSNYKDQILIREERNLAKFEEVDLIDSSQTCTRCGKKFERKAALQSHMQLCKTLTNQQQSAKEVKVTEKLHGSQKRKQAFNQIKSIKKSKLSSAEPEKIAIGGSVSSSTSDAKDEDDSSDDVVFVQSNVVEPETIVLDELDETPPVAVAPAAVPDEVEVVMEAPSAAAASKPEDPLVCEEVVLESDGEEDRGQQVTLEGKAAPYVDLSQFRCTTCECNFKHQSGLMQHMATHFKWFKYQCHICLFKSYNRSTCEDHVKSYHKSNNSKNVVTELPVEETIRISTDFQALSYAPVEKFIIKTKNATTQICKSNRHPRKGSCEEKDEEKTCNGVVKEAWKVIESKTSNGLVLKLKAASNGEKSASPTSPSPSTTTCTTNPEEQQTKPPENEPQSEENNMHKMIMEVIFGPEMSSRPIRNRVTSKKNDFIYYEKP